MTAAIEGAVIVPEPRRRERNAARTPEILPPDVDTKVSALRRIDSPEAQTAAVTVMLNHARTGLLAAIAAHDLPDIVNYKAKASAIHEITKQLRLGKDMQLDAAEFCRRAERGLGVAIREGQERGDILRPREKRHRAANQYSGDVHGDTVYTKPSPTDFAKPDELNGTGSSTGIYALVDNISEEQFDGAIKDARAQAEAIPSSGIAKLSRANVARKAKAKATLERKPVIPEDDPLIDADIQPDPGVPGGTPQPKKRLTKHNSTEMLANINGMLNGLVESLPFIDPTDIDADRNAQVIRNIRHSMGAIRRLLKDIEHG